MDKETREILELLADAISDAGHESVPHFYSRALEKAESRLAEIRVSDESTVSEVLIP